MLPASHKNVLFCGLTLMGDDGVVGKSKHMLNGCLYYESGACSDLDLVIG